jgi:signal transduction histidine kinase
LPIYSEGRQPRPAGFQRQDVIGDRPLAADQPPALVDLQSYARLRAPVGPRGHARRRRAAWEAALPAFPASASRDGGAPLASANAANEIAAQLSDSSQLLSVISHDLQTPLSSIRGFVDILLGGRTGKVTEQQREILGTMRLAATQLSHLVNDLVDGSQYVRGALQLDRATVDLASTVAQHVRLFEPLIADTEVRLVNRLHQSIGRIWADEQRLLQVLNNLISNAIKFTHPSGTVTVSGFRRRGEVVLSVTDTGIGLDRDDLARVFDPFYRAPAARRAGIQGKGLGLAVSRYIVEAHGGRIWAESRPGTGSRFSVALPTARYRG